MELILYYVCYDHLCSNIPTNRLMSVPVLVLVPVSAFPHDLLRGLVLRRMLLRGLVPHVLAHRLQGLYFRPLRSQSLLVPRLTILYRRLPRLTLTRLTNRWLFSGTLPVLSVTSTLLLLSLYYR